MIARCVVEHNQSVPIPLRPHTTSSGDPRLHMAGSLDDMILTFRSVANALEDAADELVEVYGLSAGDDLVARVEPVASAVRVKVSCVHYREEEDG